MTTATMTATTTTSNKNNITKQQQQNNNNVFPDLEPHRVIWPIQCYTFSPPHTPICQSRSAQHHLYTQGEQTHTDVIVYTAGWQSKALAYWTILKYLHGFTKYTLVTASNLTCVNQDLEYNPQWLYLIHWEECCLGEDPYRTRIDYISFMHSWPCIIDELLRVKSTDRLRQRDHMDQSDSQWHHSLEIWLVHVIMMAEMYV